MDSPSEDDSLPSPGADLEREERVVLSGGEEEAPPCPEEEELDDEWANDDDAGYLLEPITEEEFLEIEERFSKIFSLYHEDSGSAAALCLGAGGSAPEHLMDDLRLDGPPPLPVDPAPVGADEARSAAEDATDPLDPAKKKKRRNKKKKKQSAETSAVADGQPPGSGKEASPAATAEGYEGMDADLAAIALDFSPHDDVVAGSAPPAGKKSRNKKNRNRRRQSTDAGGPKMDPAPPASPPPLSGDAQAAVVTPPAQQKGSQKKKIDRKSRGLSLASPAEDTGCDVAGTPLKNPDEQEAAGEGKTVAVTLSPADHRGQQPLGSGSGKKKRNRRKSGKGGKTDLNGAIAMDTPEPPSALHTPSEKPASLKRGRSSNKKAKGESVKATPTPDELVAGTFAAPPSPHGSVGNVGFAAGEDGAPTQHSHSRTDVEGQKKYTGVDGDHHYYNLKVVFNPFRTGFEEEKDFNPPPGTVVVGRYEICETLGQAAFSTAYQCLDLEAGPDEHPWVCLKVIKNSKDFFDQSLDEIKLLQYINSKGDPEKNNVLRMIDFFYCKEHLFIVSELLRENLYDFGKFIRDSGAAPYFTLNRLKKIMHQVLEALVYIHSLGLIHCDIKPENIVIKSYSRCEVKLIDFGSSCFVTDHLTTYIQSRSYRAPEVILGMPYDFRIDIWSLGGVLAEMFTGYVLFQNDSIATMLARISGILGPFPEALMRNQTECGKYFVGGSNIVYECNDDGYFIVHPKKANFRRRLHVFSEPSDEASDEDLFVDFVARMLELDPYKRWTAVDALSHPWLRDVFEVDVAYSST